MSEPDEMTLVAFPRIVGIVAEACYNDPDARKVADKENLVDFDDADVSTQQFWRHIARTAMEASGHTELVEALDGLIELARPNVYPQPDKPDSPYAKLERAWTAILKARGEAA